jgi:acetyl-CoA synthetase
MHSAKNSIVKQSSDREAANLHDYDKTYASFSWDLARETLTGLPNGGLNIAFEAVDRHVENGDSNKVALCWHSRTGARQTYTYKDLSQNSSRFASVLKILGVNREERVFSLLGRQPELYFSVLGTFKAGCVYCPLFSAFGPEPVQSRMEIGDARVLVTTSSLYKRKVAPIRESIPNLKAVLLADADAISDVESGVYALRELMQQADENFNVVNTKPEDPALLHFTSGTTGKPKGALHVHGAVLAHCITGQYALDLHGDDIYWCTADPGWVTGTSYGIIAPLTIGVTMIVDEADFDVERWYRLLASEKVSVWYTAPTAIRMLMKAGAEIVKSHDLSSLRFLASVGEPLNPEAVTWSERVFGRPFHDNWWQTETGGIMIANYASMDVKPGSMGKPLPGIQASIVAHEGNTVRTLTEPMQIGELALRAGWPSMMREYIGERARYDKCFVDGWYLSGDLAMRDVDGYFWFVGRSDDLIKSAGHLIGPFEVESVLMEHEAVAEAGVIGIPDDTAGEIVKAFVGLKPGFEPDDELRLSLLAHARRKLGPAVAPRAIEFRKNLPKTRSGKIMRRLLKARELGLPEGDISTLESDEQ